MRVLMLVGCFSGFCFMTLVCVSTELRAAQVEETLFEAINRLPEAERQARLVNGAKKEGAVTWYVAMNRAYAQDLINAFEADYPFLKVNALTASGASLLNRVLTEYRARSYLYDVFNTRSTTIGTLKKAGAKKGQGIMYGHGRWVGHKEIKASGPDDIGNRNVVIPSPEKWGDRYQDLVALYNKILMRQ